RANKLLICAPSNAAVDEIVKRLKSGIRDEAGNTFFPSVVRVGQADNISSTVRDTTLDFLVEKALNAYGGDSETSRVAGDKSISDSQSQLLLGVTGRTRRDGKVGAQASAAKDEQRTAMDSQRTLRRQLDEVNAEIRELELRMQSTDPSDTAAMRGLRDQFRQCNEQKRSTMQKLNLERSRMREATEKVDATKRKIRLQILQTADILSCTLSGSGHDIMTSLGCTFDTVIIDEAAQSVELACLIPLKYGCERCILVGDPNQLPPTVLSQPAMQYMYNQSMFVRIQKNSPSLVSLLSIQYRMHPEISAFPSKLFYESRLKDGPDMDKKQAAPWHKNPNYPPFTFFNIYSGREQTDGLHSVYNAAEVDAAAQLVFSLCSDFPSLSWKQKIGIITPYKRQLRMLTTKFKLIFGPSIIEAIEFNTVDGFQGQEKEVIIFSCVRAGGSGVGFLSDERRMNVGLTRARKSLFVLGNADSLASSPLWRQMTDDARSRRLLKDSTMPLFGRQVRNGSKLDCLLGDAANTMDKGTDGEGSRDLFTMEPIDDEALSRFNKAIENIKVGDCGPGADVPESGDKRMYAAPEGDNGAELAMMYDTLPDKTAGKRNSSRDESHRKRPRQSQSPAASRSSSKPANGASQSTTLPDSLDSKRLNPELQHGDSSRSTSLRPPLPTASVPNGQDRQVQLHAEREKQRSSLFIPRKRGPRTSSREPSGEHSRVSSSVQEPTTPVEMRPPPPPPSVPPPPPPAEYSPPPLKNAATIHLDHTWTASPHGMIRIEDLLQMKYPHNQTRFDDRVMSRPFLDCRRRLMR
ncbi:DEAD-box type RNA helicase, partial [Coemansia thaxteri]